MTQSVSPCRSARKRRGGRTSETRTLTTLTKPGRAVIAVVCRTPHVCTAACPWRQIRMGRQLRITADQYKQCWGDRIATDQDKLVDLLQKQADAAAAAPSPTPAAPASRAPSDAASDVASVSGSTSRSSVPSSRMDARLKVEDLQEKLAAELRMRDELEMRLASIRGQ